MKITHSLSAIALSLSLVFAGSAMAQAPGPVNHGSIEDMIVKTLELTPDQVSKIKAIRAESDKQIAGIDQSKLSNQALQGAIKHGTWDDAAIRSELAEVGKVQQEVRYYRTKKIYEISKVLTADQKAKLAEMLDSAPH